MDHPMMHEQRALEAEMRIATRARYFTTHEKAEAREEMADTHAGRNVFDHIYDPFLSAVKDWVKAREAGQAGPRGRAYHLIKDFGDTPALSYVFLRHILNGTMKITSRQGGARKTRVVLAAVQAIHDEHRMRYFAENRRPLLRRIIEDFQHRELPRRRKRELMIKQFHTQQLEWKAEGWGTAERLNLGIVLLDLLIRSTGVIGEYKEFSGKKSIDCIALTPEMQDIIAQRMDHAADLFTVYYPMVVPPKPWNKEALIGGAYYTTDVEPYRLVKGSKVHYLRELESRNIDAVIDPINALQETPWRINPVMVEALNYVYSHNLEVKGLPKADNEELPASPPDIEENEDIKKEYMKDCYLVHDKNRRSISKRIAVLRTLSMANRFAQYDAIYFPHDLDSRGRAYPLVPFLNPQGTDYSKALLEFAQGKPIYAEDYSLYYLSIAIANAWGKDKLPLDERADWVEDNQKMLCEIAQDPTRDLRWLQADEPFMALRGALEWAGYDAYGDGYLSHMPVHFDATCSGLQHFSALLKDAEGGFYVNLTGEPERQDIYAAVARKATATIQASNNNLAAAALRIGINRSLCKRPVMIVPYAGTFSSCMSYVYDYYRELIDEGEDLGIDTKTLRTKLVPFVAKHVWDAISETVIAARSAMDWITHTARLASKDCTSPIQWTTPDGFVVQQARYKETTQRVETYLDGNRRVQLSVYKETMKLDPQKMAQSLSPNYIHSLDACHLRSSINKALEVGGMSFAMIHDSFGVHAADMAVFVENCIKPAFIEMYEDGEQLNKFKEELKMTIQDHNQIKDMPSMGSLDIRGVAQSQFFFS